MNYAIILAGGSGIRFWPLSRHYEPKQFLNVCSDRPMIEETIKRIQRFIEKKNIYVATNKIYHRKVKNCLSRLDIPIRNIFLEPQARNTLSPIGLTTSHIYNKDNEAVILALPCDHYIKDRAKFLRTLDKAITVAKRGYIVTLGVIPDRPETGYGYIKIKSEVKNQKSEVYKVDGFYEKPNLKKAKTFLKDKRYYWNAGIFIFRADIMLEEIKKFAPSDFRLISKIQDNRSLNKLWSKLTSISIDYAIMEKTHKIALIPADFAWMDLGSWQAIEWLAKKDKDGNIFRGNCIDLGSKKTLAWSENRLLATIGLDNIIIVNTKDALLVCAKEKTQDVKKLVEILKAKKLKKLL